jgi:hypothetical protein
VNVKRILKRVAVGTAAVVAVVLIGGTIYAKVQASAFDESMDKVYDVPIPQVARSNDPAIVARGKHLTDSVAGCSAHDCHGNDLAGGRTMDVGPIMTFTAPNITPGGLCAAYNDGELARLIQHGIKKDGRSVRFMPSQDFGWLPDADVAAIVSYLRTVPSSDKPNGPTELKLMGKVLDRRNEFALDVARRIDHTKREAVPAPAPTPEYGTFLARMCTGCHGEKHLSGGKIPGAPPSIPIPSNLTPHETGLKGWAYDDFEKLLTQGVRKNGSKLNPFMPFEAFGKMDDTEKHALWAHLQSLPPTPMGNR